MFSIFRHLFDVERGSGEQYFECRQCGLAVNDPDQACPFCGSVEIAAYKLSS
jgi:rubrerythrin